MAGNIHAQRKYLYGITPDEFSAILRKQGGKCAVCGEGETKLSRYGSVRSLSIDHCHTTGKIRGLLCDRCNRVLGFVQDAPALLRRMAAYLEVADTGHKKSVSMVPNADDLLNEMNQP